MEHYFDETHKEVVISLCCISRHTTESQFHRGIQNQNKSIRIAIVLCHNIQLHNDVVT